MEISIKLIVLITSIVLTGLTAGLCFTWGNAVTPGIGRLDDLGFLQSFQEMNRAIINPTFLLVFMGPVLLHVANVFLFKNAPKQVWLLIVTAAVIYFAGLFLVTVLGNVPLNEMLDKTDLNAANADELATLREKFEAPWNRLHNIRTISTILSVILLTLSLWLSAKGTNILIH